MMKLKNLIALGILGVLTLGVGVGVRNNTSTLVHAADSTITDTITAISDFTNAPSSYKTDGTEYEYASTASGNSSAVVYSATGISTNSGGTIRGNKNGLSNFNFRNKSTFDGYYISEVVLTVSGGSLAISSGRSELYLKSSVMEMSESAPSDAIKIDGVLSGDNKIITWTNSEQSELGYLMLYSLKTSGTAKFVSLSITWVQMSDPSAPSITINEGNQELEIDGNVKLTVSFANVEETQVSWSVENDNIATVDENGLVTAIASGSTKITATINVNDVQYSDSVIVYVLYSEPAPIEIGVADILDTEADPTVLYRVTGKISKLGQDGGGADKYGNIHLADLKNLDTTILVYGSTFTETALTFDNKTGNFQFSNPQDYLTNEQSKALKIGDIVELLVFRLDYKDQKELNGIFTKVYSDEEVVDLFVANYMHPEIDYGDPGTGLCTTEGWYYDAKVAFNQLTHTQRELFATNEKYLQPYARLSAWAKANGDTFDASNMLVSASNNNALIIDEQNYLVIIVTISMLSISVIALFAISKKRKTIKK